MMGEDERQTALAMISRMIPETVFNRFINILCMIEERNNDALVGALCHVIKDKEHSFSYRMNTDDTEETITPIREVLDLFEGWFITSKAVVTSSGRIKWDVESLEGKEVNE